MLLIGLSQGRHRFGNEDIAYAHAYSIPDAPAGDPPPNAVDAGDYASNSEIVREALRLWERQEEVRALVLDQLRRAYTEGIASGEGRKIDAPTLLRELKYERRTRG